jgi:hypothetical protein
VDADLHLRQHGHWDWHKNKLVTWMLIGHSSEFFYWVKKFIVL